MNPEEDGSQSPFQPAPRRTFFRRMIPWVGAVVLAVAIYDGAIFYSRWSDNRAFVRAQAEKETEGYRKAVALLGGGTLKILALYAAPGTIKRGEKSELCYGVAGAKTVHLEPAVDEVWPAASRCLEISPHSDTTYTLTAQDAAGHSISQNVTVTIAR